MCFSASASFVASGGLTVLGAATFVAARKKDKVLVAIPILFGIQQCFEGIQWLYLERGSSSLWAGYGFLFFALLVWPFYVPAFVWLLDKPRRPLLRWFVIAGALVSLYFLGLLAFSPLHIRERGNCVAYAFHYPDKWVVLPYLAVVLGALFVSSRVIFRWFGVAIFAMAVLAWRLYETNFISVWCFFAAAVSSLFFIFVQRRRSRRGH
ncbi:MAG TPA: DUF6629 family protein [Fibrobacteria bacterium]|jgi:heme/copper-type cytochrome/quinol oxidase subunit 4|nr:DUF6629 family protein [Fibrobacteria bacterium]